MIITGDKHGDMYSLKDEVGNIVILGDSGIDYNDYARKDCYNIMRNSPNGFFIGVRGNHEERPENLPNFYKKEYCDIVKGEVYKAKKLDNLIFLIDGNIYTIEGYKILVLGGAYSIDKFYRLQNNYKWFKDEQLSQEEMDNIFEKIKGVEVDLVFSHTCPFMWQPTETFLIGFDQSTVDNNMEHFLSKVEKNITYKHWYFGHFHTDREINEKATVVFHNEIKI